MTRFGGSSSLRPPLLASTNELFTSSRVSATGGAGIDISKVNDNGDLAATGSTTATRSTEDRGEPSGPERPSEGQTPRQEAARPRRNKKTPHNAVEKRYRMNLNTKIAELGECIPSLRATRSTSASMSDDDDVPGKGKLRSGTSHVVKKGDVLTKATEHIFQLRQEMEKLRSENLNLKQRMALLRNLTSVQSADP